MSDGVVSEGPKDKTTIGLTQKARDIADRIKENEHIEDLMDVAVIAMGVALSLDAGLGAARDAVTTWNVGTFDSSGSLKELVLALYDDLETPFRQIEYLVNMGLEYLSDRYAGAEASTNLAAVLKALS